MPTIPCREEKPTALSRAVQEYLVAIARLRAEDAPVPLSLLAKELGISPVSANEMCRKLQDQGLTVYQPYKGVTLTPKGNEHALYVLRRHRLWEVFLVDHLGMGMEDAHVAACGLEHETSAQVASHLDRFLKQPALNPEGEPIPPGRNGAIRERSIALISLQVGQSGMIAKVALPADTAAYFATHLIRPGSTVTLLALGASSLLVATSSGETAIERSLAERIQVVPQV